MLKSTSRLVSWGMATVMTLLVAGCNSLSSPLPETVNLKLPDSSTEDAERGAGAESLASTQWALYDARNQQFLTFVVFDADGSLDAFVENAILGDEIFGDRIEADGATHATSVQGLSYAAATYGAENDSGFAYQFRAVVMFAGIKAGSGRATAMGTHTETTMEGTFSYKTQVDRSAGVDLPEGVEGEDEFPFYGVLMEE